MRLKELSGESGITTASIKFYLREGLLQPGRHINPTLAEYGAEHVERLRLIRDLRRVVGLNLSQARTILAASDAGEDTLRLLGVIQRTVLGLEVAGSGDTAAGPANAVVALRGWPDRPSDARTALNEHLARMAALGVNVPVEVLAAYGAAADQAAAVDVDHVAASASRDALIRTAAVGMHLHGQLLLRMVALAQASHSMRRFGADPPTPQEGP